MKFTIIGRLSGLNEYTLSCRGNMYGANSLKKKNQKVIFEEIREAMLKPISNYPVNLKITWYEPNKRRDIDNIVFATKFIQDSLVESGILENDSQKFITGLNHTVMVDTKNPRIEVEIMEV